MTRLGDSLVDRLRARPVKWAAEGPAVRSPEAAGRRAVPIELPWLDGAAFLGQFAPELARLAGVRVSLRQTPAPEDGKQVRLVRLLEARTGNLDVALDLDRVTLCLLLERMFGGAAESGLAPRDVLSLLSPSAASWRGLSACVSQAFRAGLGAALGQPASAPIPVSRIADAPVDGPAVRLWFTLAVDGAAGWLVLACRDLAAESADGGPGAAAEAAAHTPTAWADRAASMVNSIDLPVGVRVSEQRLPLGTVLALGPGSILPIDRPRELVLIVDGKPWRHFDTAVLASPEGEMAP